MNKIVQRNSLYCTYKIPNVYDELRYCCAFMEYFVQKLTIILHNNGYTRKIYYHLDVVSFID